MGVKSVYIVWSLRGRCPLIAISGANALWVLHLAVAASTFQLVMVAEVVVLVVVGPCLNRNHKLGCIDVHSCTAILFKMGLVFIIAQARA